MKNQPLISVIIPTYNEEDHILACIDSILGQSYSTFELMIVDDGSTDDTPLLLEEIKRTHPGVKLLHQKHGGPGKARNMAARQARGEILVFVDADMTFDRDFLTDLSAPIIEGFAKGTFSKEEYVSNFENIWSRCWNYNQNWTGKKLHPESLGEEGTDFRAILKSEFLRVGGFDDWGYTDTWSLFKKLGYRPRVAVRAKYYHNNPDTLGEVFVQSKWSAKRGYKLGFLGKLLVLSRFLLPVSIIVGILKSVKYKETHFLIFKIIYDLGSFVGILEMIITGKKSK